MQMVPSQMPTFLLLLGLIVCEASVGPLFAQGAKTGLSPENQQKYDDLMRSAKTNEMIAYIGIGVAILFVVLAIPLSIYFDRRKKARQEAADTGRKRSRRSKRSSS